VDGRDRDGALGRTPSTPSVSPGKLTCLAWLVCTPRPGLADDWMQNQQTCVDVPGAYLRSPYDLDPGEDAIAAKRTAYSVFVIVDNDSDHRG
jgi:hypothetical protein